MAKYKKVCPLEMHTRKSQEMMGRDRLGNLSVDGTTVLKWVVKDTMRSYGPGLTNWWHNTECVSAVMNLRIK
jgi:hypothetical protein